jgi:hypothetical protein
MIMVDVTSRQVVLALVPYPQASYQLLFLSCRHIQMITFESLKRNSVCIQQTTLQ